MFDHNKTGNLVLKANVNLLMETSNSGMFE